MAKPFNYIDGIPLFTARKFARFAFADDFISMEKNLDLKSYDVYVREGVDEDMLEYYKEFFGPSYRVFIISEDET